MILPENSKSWGNVMENNIKRVSNKASEPNFKIYKFYDLFKTGQKAFEAIALPCFVSYSIQFSPDSKY